VCTHALSIFCKKKHLCAQLSLANIILLAGLEIAGERLADPNRGRGRGGSEGGHDRGRGSDRGGKAGRIIRGNWGTDTSRDLDDRERDRGFDRVRVKERNRSPRDFSPLSKRRRSDELSPRSGRFSPIGAGSGGRPAAALPKDESTRKAVLVIEGPVDT
jgi:hypothetical protein